MARQKIDSRLKSEAQQKVFGSLNKSVYHLPPRVRKEITLLYDSLYFNCYRYRSKFATNGILMSVNRAEAESQGWQVKQRVMPWAEGDYAELRVWVHTEEE